MSSIRLTLTPRAGDEAPVELAAPDVATALTIADINVEHGTAEFYENGERIARLTKRGGDHATFWKVD